MITNTIKYYFREALLSLVRNSWLTTASVGTIAISLLILGGSMLLVMNMHHVVGDLESSLEIMAFLEEGLTQEQMDKIGADIKALPAVSEVTFVTKEEALDDFEQSFVEQGGLIRGLEEEDNPLPYSYKVKTKEAEQVPETAEQLKVIVGVERLSYAQGVVEKLLSFTYWIRIWGFLALVILALAATVLIVVSIRMSIFSRRLEISIMKMIGATNFFVRAPFMLEGMIIGFIGGIIAIILLDIGYWSLLNKVALVAPFLHLIDKPLIVYQTLGCILLAGLIAGALGSAISLHRFLKV